MKVTMVVGARPNFMKIAPLARAFQRREGIRGLLVHTGQHYDERMSHLFFEQLDIPRPDVNLEVGSASHAVQTAEIMKRFEPVLLEQQPDVVLVVGDVNSTVACALVAAKLHVPVAHVEAGLRSFDRRMPEEINRVLTDAVSDFLFVTEPSGLANLKNEGVPDKKVHFVGNVMIDTLLANLEKARESRVLHNLGLEPRGYAAMTLHRPSNVDDRETFDRVFGAIRTIADDLPVVFPAHPRTRKNMEAFGYFDRGGRLGGVRVTEPLGYLDFLRLMAEARLVLTDSGGIQEETTILKVPCLTLRAGTERPVTVDVGCNQIVGTDPEKILAAYRKVADVGDFTCGTPEKWDGHAAERIAEVLVSRLSESGAGMGLGPGPDQRRRKSRAVPQNRSSRVTVSGQVVIKTGPPERMIIEAEKTSRAARIGEETGLFTVPRILDFDSSTGRLTFRRIPGLRSVMDVLAFGEGGEDLLRQAAAALAAVHERLVMSEVRPLPEYVALPGPSEVFIHGDYNVANVCIDAEDRPVIIDWCTTDRRGGFATWGTRYFDVGCFVTTLFHRPLHRYWRAQAPEPQAKAFLHAYYEASGFPYLRDELTEYLGRLVSLAADERRRRRSWVRNLPMLWCELRLRRFVDHLHL